MQKFIKYGFNVLTAAIGMLGILLLLSLMPLGNIFHVLVVQSGSMEPTIKTGGVVIVWPAASYQVGDIVTYGRHGWQQSTITHRIIDSRQQAGQTVFITQGDANNASDSRPVEPGEILGKVRFHLPYVGYALDWAKRPLGFLLVIGLPALVIISDEIKKILVELKKKKTYEKH